MCSPPPLIRAAVAVLAALVVAASAAPANARDPDHGAPVLVTASAPAHAYTGDRVTVAYTVTSDWQPLMTLDLADAGCDTIRGPIRKENDDRDDVLDPQGPDAWESERWIYECTFVMGDAPATGSVTATALDSHGETVTATAAWSVQLLKSRVALHVDNDPAGLRITATNTGDASFPATDLTLAATICADAPVREGDGSLDPGETWSFRCGAGPAQGTVVLTGVDDNDHRLIARLDLVPGVVDSVASSPTGPPPSAKATKPIRKRAHLRMPRKCVRRGFTSWVAGHAISRVDFWLDRAGPTHVTQPSRLGRFTLPILAGSAPGVHRVRAVVRFVDHSQSTLTGTFYPCAVVRPYRAPVVDITFLR